MQSEQSEDFQLNCLPACLWLLVGRSSTMLTFNKTRYVVDAVTLSGILKAKQKLGVTFNSDKLG